VGPEGQRLRREDWPAGPSGQHLGRTARREAVRRAGPTCQGPERGGGKGYGAGRLTVGLGC
jgi:hypothetical protein